MKRERLRRIAFVAIASVFFAGVLLAQFVRFSVNKGKDVVGDGKSVSVVFQDGESLETKVRCLVAKLYPDEFARDRDMFRYVFRQYGATITGNGIVMKVNYCVRGKIVTLAQLKGKGVIVGSTEEEVKLWLRDIIGCEVVGLKRSERSLPMTHASTSETGEVTSDFFFSINDRHYILHTKDGELGYLDSGSSEWIRKFN